MEIANFGVRSTLITRKSLLKGMAAAGVVTTIGDTALRAQMQLPFDVRALVPGSESDDACVQCVYTTINRMAVLIGDVPFHQLLGTPMQQLIPGTLLPRTQTAAALGLIQDPGLVMALLQSLLAQSPRATLAGLFAGEQTSDQASQTLVRLWHSGIRLTIPPADAQPGPRSAVVERLLQAAPAFTFIQLFTRSALDTPAHTLAAVRFARENALFAWYGNYRCCNKANRCKPTSEQSWCNEIISGESIRCSDCSDPCTIID